MNDMKTSNRKSRWALGLLPVLVAGWIGLTPLAAFAHPWVNGNVYAAISNGQYQQYSSTGATGDLLQVGTIGRPDGGFTAGCGFNPAGNPPGPVNLYTTVWHENKIVISTDAGATHGLPPVAAQVIDTSLVSPGHPETIVFNTAGDFFVGLVDAPLGQANLLKYSKANVLLGKWELTRGARGVDSIDLAPDQDTIYYTSEDNVIRTFTITSTAPGGGTGTQGIYHTGAASSRYYGIRLLQGGNVFGNGTSTPGFLMVADTQNIKVLNAAGTSVMNTYGTGVSPHPVYGNGWFSVSVDSGGGAFVAGDFYSGRIVKFNADGTVAPGYNFVANPQPFRVNGVCVKGELTVGVVPFPAVGFYVVGDTNAGLTPGPFTSPPAPNSVTFNHPTWSAQNTMSLGDSGDSAFKGFAETTIPATADCGGLWGSKGGNTSNTAVTIGQKVAILVTKQVTSDGTYKAKGNIDAIVLVQVTSITGGGNPRFVGTVVDVICVL